MEREAIWRHGEANFRRRNCHRSLRRASDIRHALCICLTQRESIMWSDNKDPMEVAHARSGATEDVGT